MHSDLTATTQGRLATELTAYLTDQVVLQIVAGLLAKLHNGVFTAVYPLPSRACVAVGVVGNPQFFVGGGVCEALRALSHCAPLSH